MFLHLGGDVLTELKNVIVIINSENALGIDTNQNFFKKVNDKGIIQKIDSECAKSIILTDEKIYLSPISSQTLKKRANFVNQLV